MSRIRSADLVVRCSVRDGTGAVVERLLVRVPAGAPASAVLGPVLRRALAERRRDRALVVDEPPEVAALLELCGFGDGPDVVRP